MARAGLAGVSVCLAIACLPFREPEADSNDASRAERGSGSSSADPISFGARAAHGAGDRAQEEEAGSGPDAAATLATVKGTTVLHFGDSFVAAGLAQALKLKMRELGVRYEARSQQSSYTTTWAGKAKQVILDTQPDLVLITLGANEIANTNPNTHAPAVRRIIDAVGGRPCVWISPPLWRKDTGIIDVIRTNSAPCRFFDSDALVGQPVPRQSDKIHPTMAGGALWAETVWRWLLAERSGAAGWSLKLAAAAEHASKPNP